MRKRNVIIMGAAGRDFHNFNTFFRSNQRYNVVCFTAAQIPFIEKRVYPKSLAGKLYKRGIPIYPEEKLPQLIKKLGADVVVFSYSDVSHVDVMHKASMVLSSGASFMMLGPNDTMLRSKKPVIAVCAVRTGAGKSPATRKISLYFKNKGKRVAVIRHPMPYGNLEEQAVQRFYSFSDLDKFKCTIEEREEYEPHIQNGVIVYAGVDYEKILAQAEKEADVIIFDGGNNDFSFIRPDLLVVLADACRPGHELLFHPGETNFRMADVIIINKADFASKASVEEVEKNARLLNPNAMILKAKLELIVDKGSLIRGKRVLCIEDGPTLTHGGMAFGAALIAAKKFKAKKIVPPEKFAVGTLKEIYRKYPHVSSVLPAMGYNGKQVKELQKTISSAPVDVVIDGTPVNLSKLIKIGKPIVNVDYELKIFGGKTLSGALRKLKI